MIIRCLAVLMICLTFSACTTTEEVADDEPEFELEEVEIDERLLPEWYAEGETGKRIEGKLSGYARSLGSSGDWALENALSQARVNLRSWVDSRIEEVREQVAEVDDTASDREFIIQLRNAVVQLEFEDAEVQSKEIDYDGSIHSAVRIDVEASEVLQQIENRLSGYTEIWNRMLEQEPLQGWR